MRSRHGDKSSFTESLLTETGSVQTLYDLETTVLTSFPLWGCTKGFGFVPDQVRKPWMLPQKSSWAAHFLLIFPGLFSLGTSGYLVYVAGSSGILDLSPWPSYPWLLPFPSLYPTCLFVLSGPLQKPLCSLEADVWDLAPTTGLTKDRNPGFGTVHPHSFTSAVQGCKPAITKHRVAIPPVPSFLHLMCTHSEDCKQLLCKVLNTICSTW